MKNSIITYLFGFFFLITCFKAIGKEPLHINPNSCLEIDGKIINASEGSEGACTVELLCSNTIVASTVLKDGKKKFRFLLDKNAAYTIRISKRGYITKLVSVDTKMAEVEDELYSFSFETSLIAENASKNMNKDLLDFPIALIYFDNKKDCFVYDKEYTSKIKKEIVMK